MYSATTPRTWKYHTPSARPLYEMDAAAPSLSLSGTLPGEWSTTKE